MSDLINRQDAIDAVKRFLKDDDDWFQEAAASMIRMLPSADRPTEWCPLAEPKTGKWVLEEYKSHNHIENFYICSSCRNFEAWGKTELYNYCPNCGAKMYKGGESK